MATNPNINDYLARQMFNTAQVPIAKAGGYGGKGLNLFSNLMALGAAAFPNSPLFQGGNALAQNMALQRYGRYLQQQAEEAQRLALMAQQDEMADNLAIANAMTGGIANYRGKQRLTADEINHLRQIAANPDFANWMETGEFHMTNPYGAYGDIPKTMQQRAQDVMDAQETMGQLPRVMADGPIGQAIFDQIVNPGLQRLQNAGMDTSEMGISTGVTKRQPITPAMAGTMAKPDISQLLTGRKNEQGYRTDVMQRKETERHNKQTEATDRIKAQADMLRAQKYQPGGGSGGSPTVEANRVQEFLKSQLGAIDSQLKAEGVLDQHGKIRVPLEGFFSSPQHRQRVARIQQLVQARNELLRQISGGGLAFGGQSNQRLQSIPMSFSEWKQRKQGR
ncbi:MAG TPA: hypothetical protein V6C99_12365 [Oculatellaceae cyanobacterium]